MRSESRSAIIIAISPFRKLISPWPRNAFITGVKITDISSVHIVINGVDPNIKYENNTTTLNHIREVYGIFKIERIFF